MTKAKQEKKKCVPVCVCVCAVEQPYNFSPVGSGGGVVWG